MSILQSKPGTYNEKTIVNCAVSLAFLSAYASDPSQMNALYEAFDNTLNFNISLGIKYGILLNGNSADKK